MKIIFRNKRLTGSRCKLAPASSILLFLGAIGACPVALSSLPGMPKLAAGGIETIFLSSFEASETGSGCGAVVFSNNFTQANGTPWPAPWVMSGNNVDLAVIQNGAALLRSNLFGDASAYPLARMVAPMGLQDVEVRFRFLMENVATQGVGFYVRQNGGSLLDTVPAGQGYGVFIEGPFYPVRGAGIGLWREIGGEEALIPGAHSGPAPAQGVFYNVRFRVQQLNASSTSLQAKFWADNGVTVEPADWQVSVIDNTAVLQGISGGIAVDSYQHEVYSPASIIRIDDIEVEALCNPLAALPASAELVSGAYNFAEGPLWRGTHLLFTDINTNTIHQLNPVDDTVSTFLNPSDNANGLALDNAGNLLAAEHATRRVSITNAMDVRSTLVEFYEGDRFNSPNDLAVRSDGTLYFTDPDYGLTMLGLGGLRELEFNGLFRRQPDGTLIAEWQGEVGVNQPNGVALSPDEDFLYVTDTQAGTLRRWNVAPSNGALSNPLILATGLTIPDGLCVDTAGNVYVATWNSAVRVYDPEGVYWGSITVPEPNVTNCEFGDADGQSLYITAQNGLYRAR